MTVQSQTSRADYDGNGATTLFVVPFYFLLATDLQVIRTDDGTAPPTVTTLVLNADYTVAGVANPAGGSITTTVAPSSMQRLSILRKVPYTQLKHYVPNDPFPAASHEMALDKLTMEVQQLAEVQSRALTLPENVTGVSNLLPPPESNKLIGWNQDADALQNVDPATLATIVAFGTAKADIFSGDGVTTDFTLSVNPGALANLHGSIGAADQRPGIDFTWSGGTTVHFVTPPPVGTQNILFQYMQGLPQGASDSAASSFVQAGTGAVPRFGQDKMRERVSVEDFGAVADWNGTTGTDNTAAFQAALNTMKTVQCSDGLYRIAGVLTMHSGQYLVGPSPVTAAIGGPGSAGARLVFTGAGPVGIKSDPAQASEFTHYLGIMNLCLSTDTRDYICDFNNLLQFTMKGVRIENRAANGAAFRSSKINGVAQGHTNYVERCQFSSPNGGTRPNFDVDWSDSQIIGSDLSGGAGAYSRGPGNVKFIGNQIELGSAGLTLMLSALSVPGSNKPDLVVGNTFDINTGYDIVLDARANTNGIFNPLISGNTFRSDGTSVASANILLYNTAGASSVVSGGSITGNAFSSTNRTPYTIQTAGTWGTFSFVGNHSAAAYATLFDPAADQKMVYLDKSGLHIPGGGAYWHGGSTFRGLGNATSFAGHEAVPGSPGISLGVWDGVSPFVAATRNSAGVASALYCVTDNTIRTVVAANGSAFYANADNSMTCGAASSRWSVVYAATGAINTSDSRTKQQVRDISDAERRVAMRLKSGLRAFKFNDAVALKGDGARIHFGMIAQEVKAAFESEGLSAEEYAVLCYDEWDAVPAKEEVRGDNGDIVVAASAAVPAGNIYGVRYDELLAFILSAI